MISFEMEDLIGVLQGLVPYFIAIGLVLAAAIAVSIGVKKLPQAKKKFIRGESWLAALLAILIVSLFVERAFCRQDPHQDLRRSRQRGGSRRHPDRRGGLRAAGE